MNPGGKKPSNEILTGKFDENIKISTLQDLKEALGKDIPDGIKEIEKPITVSKNEIIDLKKQILGKGNPEILLSIRSFLDKKRRNVFDSTKKTIKAFKEGAGNKEKLEKLNTQEDLEKGTNQLLDKISRTTKSIGGSNIGKKTKELGQEVKEKAKEAGNSTIGKKIMEFIGNIFRSIFSGITTGWNKLLSLFGLGAKAKEILDMNTAEYKEALSNTQDTIISTLEEKTGKTLKEEEKQRIREKLNPNNKNSYIDAENFKKLSDKIKSGEGISLEDIKDTGAITKLMKDPDLKDIIVNIAEQGKEKIFLKFKKDLQKSGIEINEGSDSEMKLKQIINRKFNESTFKKVSGEGEMNFIEPFIMGYETATFIPGVIFEMWQEDIISAKNLVVGATEKGTDKIKIGIKSLSGQDIVPDLVGKMPWSYFNEKVKGMELEKRTMLLRAFYAELGIVSGVLGFVGYYGASMTISTLEMGKNIGKNIGSGSLKNIKGEPLAALKKTFNAISTPPVKQLQETLEILKPGEGIWLNEIKHSLEKTKESYEILEKMKTANPTQKKKLLESLQKINAEIANTRASGSIGIKNEGLKSSIKAAKNPLKYHYYNKTMRDIQNITKANTKLGQSIVNGTIGKSIDIFRSMKNSWNLRYIGGHATIHLSDKLGASKFLKAFGKLSPELIRVTFGRAPIFLIGASFYHEAMKKDGDLITALKASNGFLGGFSLMKEGMIDFKSGDFNIKNAGKGALGAVVIGTETWFFTKDTIKYLGKHSNLGYGKVPVALGKAAFNSAVRIPLEMVKLGGWGVARTSEGVRILGAILKKAPKKGKAGLGVAAAAGVLLLAKNATANNIDISNIEKNEYFSNGEPNIENIKRDFAQLDHDTQEELYSLATILNLPESFKDKQDKFHFSLKDNTYRVEVEPDLLEENQDIFEQIESDITNFSYEIDTGINVVIA